MGLDSILKPRGRVSVSTRGGVCLEARCCARALKLAVLAAMIIANGSQAANVRAQKTHAAFKDRSIDLWLGGDVNLGDGGRNQLSNIAGIVQGAAGIVNLEGPVAQHARLRKSGLRLWNAPRSLKELSALNVKVAGIANNHSADEGEKSAVRTANALRGDKIIPAGEPAGPAIVHLNGFTVAVTAHDLTHGVPASLEGELKSAASKADFLIATFHVTGPPSYLPRPELKRAVEIAYKAGAVVIAAHGTHALAKVERRDHAVIAWGLGNVVFACDCTKEEDAIILRVQLELGKKPKADVLAIRAGLNKQPVRPAKDAQAIFNLLEAIGSSKLERKGDVVAF
jgi:Bacterial capsule synthesis protein PGA_cap